MKKLIMAMMLVGCICLLSAGLASAQGTCTSIRASYSGGWKPVAAAPRNGTPVEMLETFGVAPWHGLFQWADGRWQSVSDPRSGVSADDSCLFWRPYQKQGAYVDPTNGAQQGVEYWCRSMHRPYDKKTDSCR